MRRTLKTALGLGALALMLPACGDEGPTGVGGGLLGPGVRTYEVFLEAPEFLQADTTFDGLGTLNRAGFWFVADDFAGELDAAALFSLNRPIQVTYQDTTGTRSDSISAIVGGTLTLVVDTLASTAPAADVELYELTESWDRLTTSWELYGDEATAGPAASIAGPYLRLTMGAAWMR